ncbi:MAG: hypothetical protein LBU12_08925 [Deltaproteobacteria bacterium]|jgi:putative RNA 2'-phosphotransferase|nr:hypothetical protein [Deltaproteobacteria bacterium]
MSKHGQQIDNLEKMLRYALGVAPDEFALLPDAEGFVPLKELLAALRAEDGFRSLGEGRILEVLNRPGDESPLEARGAFIRLKPALAQLPPELPPNLPKPKILHLGLKPSAWAHASVHGLKPRPSEPAIRLFPDRQAARKAASRFCPEPTMIAVSVRLAEAQGAVLTPYSERMWLTDALKPEALTGPPVPAKPVEAERTSPPSAAPSPGLYAEPAVSHGKKKGKYEDAPEWKTMTRQDRRKNRE